MTELRRSFKERVEELGDGDGTDAIVDLLHELPPETDRVWELALTWIAENAPDRSGDLKRIFEADETEFTNDVRFASFFAYLTYQRRRGNIAEIGRELDEYESTFGDHPMYPHLRALHQKRLRTGSSYQQAIDYAEQAREMVGEGHEGVEHSYVTAILRALEDGHAEELDVDPETLLERAESTMERIMTEPVYPKFKVTLGRVKALQGEYGQALRLINEGVDLEDDSKDSYALRINSYRTHEVRVYLEKYRDEIESQQNKLEEAVDDAVKKIEGIRDESQEQITELQGQTLQFLGFFATLLAVIISTVTISVNFTIIPAASLIIVLVGGLLIAFGAFTVILPVDDAIKRGVILFLMGMLTTGIGITVAAAVGGLI